MRQPNHCDACLRIERRALRAHISEDLTRRAWEWLRLDLAEGEAPEDPNRYLLIEAVHEARGKTKYRVTARGYNLDGLKRGEFTHDTLDQARIWALKLADSLNVPAVYQR